MKRKRDKEETISRLLAAVGRILKDDGYAGIGINKIALEAGVSKPMIYDYFGGLNNLVKSYIKSKDYWLTVFETLEESRQLNDENVKDTLIALLQDQLRFFYKDREMQQLILWQISRFDPVMRSVSEKREQEGLKILDKAERYFAGSDINPKSVFALLVGGIYYNVLHSGAGTGTVAGIDLKDESDFELMINTVGQLLNMVWSQAYSKKKL